VEHRDRQDEGEIKPVGDVNVRFGAPHDGAKIDEQVGDPDDGEPKVGIPFGLGIFLRLGDADEIAGSGDDDKEIVAKHDEPGRDIADEARPAGTLNDVERGCQQNIAAERKNHR
jgi:hypothetical protein